MLKFLIALPAIFLLTGYSGCSKQSPSSAGVDGGSGSGSPSSPANPDGGTGGGTVSGDNSDKTSIIGSGGRRNPSGSSVGSGAAKTGSSGGLTSGGQTSGGQTSGSGATTPPVVPTTPPSTGGGGGDTTAGTTPTIAPTNPPGSSETVKIDPGETIGFGSNGGSTSGQKSVIYIGIGQ